jgi:acetoin utilization deacetylase AcuC-like enzyme
MTARGLSRRDFISVATSLLTAVLPTASRAGSSATALITHPAFTLHDPGPFIVERPARLQAIDKALATVEFASLARREAPLRDDVEQAILAAHTKEYYERVRSLASDAARLPATLDDGDTVLSVGSWEAALHAVGAGLLAVDLVMDSSSGIRNAFCQVRPPGHHAERSRAMGFCIFSNVAIAALYARAKHGVERVSVVDFDVHHGNGTQSIFWSNKNLFYGSTHEMPLFPGTGDATDTGVGNIFNAPLKAGEGSDAFRDAISKRILPAVDAFRPDIILVSAGFDAHDGDPLGHLRLTDLDFAWITEQIVEVAARRCSGRIVSMLEGGYELGALGRSAAAHIRVLLNA